MLALLKSGCYLRVLNQSTGSSTFDCCNMLLIPSAHSSQSSCLSIVQFGLRIELEFNSIPVWKSKLVAYQCPSER